MQSKDKQQYKAYISSKTKLKDIAGVPEKVNEHSE
jgi:hypothetical protein